MSVIVQSPFAIGAEDGYVYTPRQAKKHTGQSYKCMECTRKMTAKVGEKNRPHFAHQVDTSSCSGGESIYHLAAKKYLAQSHRSGHQLTLGPQHRLRIEGGIEELQVGDRIVDVLLYGSILDIQGKKLGPGGAIVEVCHTNRKDSEYISYMQQFEIPIIEIHVTKEEGDSFSHRVMTSWPRTRLVDYADSIFNRAILTESERSILQEIEPKLDSLVERFESLVNDLAVSDSGEDRVDLLRQLTLLNSNILAYESQIETYSGSLTERNLLPDREQKDLIQNFLKSFDITERGERILKPEEGDILKYILLQGVGFILGQS